MNEITRLCNLVPAYNLAPSELFQGIVFDGLSPVANSESWHDVGPCITDKSANIGCLLTSQLRNFAGDPIIKPCGTWAAWLSRVMRRHKLRKNDERLSN